MILRLLLIALGQVGSADPHGVIRDPVLSPDSMMVAYVVEPSSDKPSDVWVLSTGRGARPRRLAQGEAPTWSPDGRHLAFLGLTERVFQLWIWDREHDAVRQLTRIPGGIQPHEPADALPIAQGKYRQSLRLSWSPDGRRIAFAGIFVEPGEPVGAQLPVILTERSPGPKIWAGILRHTFGGRRYANGVPVMRTLPDSVSLRMGNESVQLFVADARTGAVLRVTTGDSAVFDPAWSPDGAAIAVASTEEAPVFSAYVRHTNLYLVDPTSGRRTRLTTGPGRKFAPHWSRDGRAIAYLLMDVGVFTVRGPFVIDVAARTVRPDTLNTLGIMPLATLTVTDEGTRLEWRASGSETREVVRIAPIAPGPTSRARAELLTWIGGRGQETSGWLRLPPGHDPSKRYPLIIDPYDEWQSHDSLLAGGYIILSPSPRTPHSVGGGGHRSEYRRIVVDSPSVAIDIAVADVMSGVDTLIRRGLVDPDRMAAVGFSNGGGAVAYLVTRTKRFKCAVIQSPAGVGDWGSQFFDDPDGEYFQTLLNDRTPWDSPSLYAALSPVYHADRIRTPLLIAVGETEAFGWVHGGLQLYGALRRLRRPVTLVRYPDQGHGLTGWALEDLAVRTRKFIDECTGRRSR